MRAILPVKVIIAVCVSVSVVSGLAGCSGDTKGVAATLLGVVVHDSNGAPIAGVKVTDNKVETTTQADGTFRLDIENDGNATVYILGNGYEIAQAAVPAGAGDIDLGQFTIRPVPIAGYGNITGIIADAGAPVANAQVWVGGNSAITGADGVYRLYNVEEGRRTVTASTGAKYGTASVLVISMRTVTADIAVTSGPPVSPF